MMITDFLLARIAEDEKHLELARDFIPDEGNQGEYLDPARVVAECEAKRRIVERCSPLAGMQVRRQTRVLARDTLCALAAVYADHPDFDRSGPCNSPNSPAQ